ncbi:ArsR family transcriptional regulator [Streptomyces sp. NPDC058289]|uniref:ArsR family transcriptional regulator n=1 Tax=Streptomyces sp. NPDC058289 TaxID=3346425 RepID=UPI0036E9B0E4
MGQGRMPAPETRVHDLVNAHPCDLAAALGISRTRLSNQLTCLRDRGLAAVPSRRCRGR